MLPCVQAVLFILVSEGVCDAGSLGACVRKAQNQIPD